MNKDSQGNEKEIVTKLGSALKVFRKISGVKFLYIDDDLLLKAVPTETITEAINNPKIPWILKSEMKKLVSKLGEVVDYCNKQVNGLKRIKKELKGIHVPYDSNLSKDLTIKISVGELVLEDLPEELHEKVILKSLTTDDYIKPARGEKLDWLNFMVPDGKVFPYTILAENALSSFGFPVGLYTKGDEDVDPESIKRIYYEDPKTKKVIKGTYFEVYEGPGSKGDGGINGVIVKETIPVIIINHKRKEAYFVNVDESKKGLVDGPLPTSRFETLA
ncbi:MAG: hypothetical protein HYR97_00045 [Candidatus Melainabacteria bacterium]|nr:hypothetical protein [Candidatus Melainabacteria bacterium]MBI3308912.1 hypothetical protein [Candidatus Melainabacteria bacterium]